MLLPFTIKDHRDINNMFAVPSDYFLHICDVTTLLYEGVIPATEKIPEDGLKYQMASISQDILLVHAGIAVSAGLLFLVTFWCVIKSRAATEVVRK
jgi:hypothetical protein